LQCLLQVLVKVLAVGVCHSDVAVQEGIFGNSFPIIPGHEIIGNVVAVPDSEKKWKEGDRVGGPWHGGHDGKYPPKKILHPIHVGDALT
jgi:D-arabinose 1-dehydrogenase-like Zn-dependent alcohol dehydrogenase